MKLTILAVVVGVVALIIGITSYKKAGHKQDAPVVQQMAAAEASINALRSSERHTALFNEAAGAMYGFQWIKDDGNYNKVDPEAGELYIPQALRAQFDLPPDQVKLTPKLAEAIANVEREIQIKRRDGVKKTLAAQKETHLWFDLATLSEPYQKAAKHLIEASYWTHELYKLQMDKNAEETALTIYFETDPDTIQLFDRNAAAICGRYGDKLCSILPDFTAPVVGAIMWPDNMDQKTFDDIKADSKDLKNDPLLSPFTVVKRDDKGELKAIPYSQFEPFKKIMDKVASLMEQASDVEGIDKSFADQLKLQAQAFRSDDPKPYFQSDEAWGKAAGELDLTVGPYETYEDPYGTKSMFEFMLGAEDKGTTEVVQKFMPVLPHIEQMFSLTVGPDIYQARTIKNVPPLRVVNVIVGTGEMRKAGGPSIAFSLPNIGPMAEEGRSKRVIFSNHHEAKYQILRPIAEIAIVPEQLQYVDPQSFVFDSTFHEIMHGIGPQRESKVGDSTVQLMIGEDYDSIEEAKANVGGVWAADVLFDNNIITQEQLKSIQTTYVAGLLRIMRFGAGEAHARGAALEFSYLFNHGAIEIKDGRFAVNYDKFQDVLMGLVGEIGRALATGDKTAVKMLLVDYPAKMPPIMNEMAKKFAVAGIPRDVALVYHVKGLAAQ